jgi:hypothetical protein
MRLLLGVIAVLTALSVAGCQNPIDPVDKSDKIQGLTWVEINSADLAMWDSDPGNDGLEISLSYKNEYGDELSFHDKSHNVVIEFWTEKNAGTVDAEFFTRDRLFYSQTIDFENSDDAIRIPYEAYISQLSAAYGGLTAAASGMLVVRVFPPEEDPRPELLVAKSGVEFYVPPTVADGTD